MDSSAFWRIVEEARADHHEEQERRLAALLTGMSERQLIGFLCCWYEAHRELYTHSLMAVATMKDGGWFSDDGFLDFRDWIISLGQAAFEKAKAYPDELVYELEANEDAGFSEASYVVRQLLNERDPKWRSRATELDKFQRPEDPLGPELDENDVERVLPKTYNRYVRNPTDEEVMWRDHPEQMIEKIGVTVGPRQLAGVSSSADEGSSECEVETDPVDEG